MNGFLVYVITVVCSVLVGMALGFCLRSHSVDKLRAEIVQLRAALDGRQIRTSKGSEAPVQPPARPVGTRRPTMTPGHAATRTEPLPSNVRYLAERSEGDVPISDADYAERFARNP